MTLIVLLAMVFFSTSLFGLLCYLHRLDKKDHSNDAW